MASNVLCGQAGLLGLPYVGNVKNAKGDKNRRPPTVSDAKLNPYLRVDRKQLKADPSSGMEVYKISKVRYVT